MTSFGSGGANSNLTTTLRGAQWAGQARDGSWPLAVAAEEPRGRGSAETRQLMWDTGFPRADAENDFLRARRHQFLAMLAHRLRGLGGDSNQIVPLEEVVGTLGWRGERQLGLQTIRLDTIVGTVDSQRDFDRRFRPTSNRVRSRWERLALAQRRGEAIPPIDVYRVGDLHFVSDGHHRVSIAAATGQEIIEAYVTQVLTTGAAPAEITH